MELQGKVIEICEMQSGVSKASGKEWASQEFVVETHEQYPKKVCFRVFGAEKIQSFNLAVGEELKVSFDIDAKLYNGRWFNSINAWKVDRETAQAPQSQQTAPVQQAPIVAPPTPTPKQVEQAESELPF